MPWDLSSDKDPVQQVQRRCWGSINPSPDVFFEDRRLTRHGEKGGLSNKENMFWENCHFFVATRRRSGLSHYKAQYKRRTLLSRSPPARESAHNHRHEIQKTIFFRFIMKALPSPCR